jgi:hypothetical protein
MGIHLFFFSHLIRMRLDELKQALKDDILFAGKTEEAFSKYRKVSFF